MKTLTNLLILILTIGTFSGLQSQTCSPGIITTQAQINDIFNSGCTMVSGDLIIEGSGINDIGLLFNLTSVSGNVIVRNCPNLTTSLFGLDLITTIGGNLEINNTGITEISSDQEPGYPFLLTSIGGDLTIQGNNSLVEIDYFPNLVTVGGKLSVKNNANLTGAINFDALTTVSGNFEFFSNGNLQSLDFPELTTISQGLAFLTNTGNFSLNGFPKLQTITDGIQLAQNNGLQQVNGFNALVNTNAIYITLNDNLTQVNGFNNLVNNTIVSLGDNLFLSNINGFSNLGSSSLIQINGNGDILTINGFGSLSSATTFEFKDNLITAAKSTGSLNLLGFNSLNTVTDLIISGNSIISNISGFSNLMTANNITISDNFGLTGISGFAGLTTISNVLEISDNTSITAISGLQALKTVNDHVNINDNPMLNSMGSFNAVETGDFIFDNNDALTTISGFTSHAQGGVVINNHAELTSVNAWKNLTSGTGFQFVANAKLSEVDGFQNMTSGVTFVDIRTNPMLSMCCFALPSIATSQNAGGTVSISGNASGCASLTQIDQAPVLNNCPADQTVNTGSNDCSGTVNLTDPTITDNCGYGTFTFHSIGPDGEFNDDGFQGLTIEYLLSSGLTTITWEVTDESGNNDICVTKITVVDNVFPVFNTELPATASISTASNSCEGTYSVTFPTATDNCGITGREITVFNQLGGPAAFANYSAVEGQSYDIPLEPGTYDLEVSVYDDGSLADVSTTVVSVTDHIAPAFTSVVPEDVTLSTDGSTCSVTHGITFPTYSDNCPGAVLARLSVFDNSNSFLTVYDNTSPTGGTTYNVILDPGEYQVEITIDDQYSNGAIDFSTILVEDNAGPTITLNQSDITVNCNQTPPSIPQVGTSVFATDACDGDVTSNMTQTSSTSSGDCTFGQEQEITTYTYSASDNSGNMSEASFTITILNNEAVDLGADKIGCTGESVMLSSTGLTGSYLWSTGATTPTISVNTAGTYTVTVTGTSGCCSIDEVAVSFQNDPDASATGGVIGCSTTSIQLMGSSTSTGISYSWTGPGGFTSNVQNPTVTSLGEYILTVETSAGCTATASATVSADTDVPNASATGGSLNCSNSFVQLMGSSTTAGVSYSWTGPNSYTSTDQSPTVTDPGIYTLTVKAANDCSITADAEVIDDTSVPVVTLNDDIINCNTHEITLTPEVSGDITSYSWTGPNGLTATTELLTITEGGSYSLSVTGSNTCVGSTSIVIVEDTETPNISAEGGEIDCSASEVTLSGSSTTPGVTYEWNGPNNFSASIPNPIVLIPGIYTLVVTGENGCNASEMVEITSDVEIPVVMAEGGIIDCINTSIELEASSETEGLTYSWIGPNGFSGDMASVTITEPGTYTVIGTHSNGCTAQDIVEVVDNAQVPSINISADDLNCANLETKVLTEGSNNISSFLWTGPDGFTSSDEEPVLSIAGSYTVIATADNGCTTETTITISEDFTEPDATAEGGTLSCSANAITLTGNSTSDNPTFSWTGPDNFTSNQQNPTASQAGTYTLMVTTENGCSAEASAEVIADTDLPNVSALGGTIDCNNDEVTLMGATTTEGATFSWSGPDGFTSSENNPIVSAIGQYTFTVESESGCSAFKTIEVTMDTLLPVVQLSFGDILCEVGSISILPSVLDGLSFAWSGPDGFESSEEIPEVSKAGIYQATITGSNGCTVSASIELENDIDFQTTVTVDGNSASIDISGGTGPFIILWDDGSDSTTAVDFSEGEHTVSVTDVLGCSKIETFTIMSSSVEDIIATLNIEIYPNPTIDILNIKWNEKIKTIQNIEVVNQSGKLVYQINKIELNNTSTSVNVANFAQGVYYIKVRTLDDAGVLKFIKI